MKIIVCMKQVPAGTTAQIDPETGAMKRSSADTRTNPYDLFALETALEIRDRVGGTVTALTMGPQSAQEMMKDAYACGADEAVILSDPKFAGSDVLATAFTLSQGVALLGGADLIICGRQTTDGDTAQVGPALAEYLGLPHAAWVAEITELNEDSIAVRQDLSSVSQESRIPYPCLITVDKDTNVPRLPSYKLKKATEGRPVRIVTFKDMPEQDMSKYGLFGSPTNVVRMFSPEPVEKKVYISGENGQEKAAAIFDILTAKKIL